MSDKEKSLHIRIRANGPYVVTGGAPLTERYPAMSSYGEPLAWDPVGVPEAQHSAQETYELCRCGHSNDKPFCDGTHEKIDFEGALTAVRSPDAKRRQAFKGHGLTLTDEPGLCSDAGFCGTRFTKVWNMIKRTNDPEVQARLRQMVANCPSGRLAVILEGDSAPEEPEFAPSIAAVPDGPLWVRGGIPIEAPDGYTYEVRNRVTLCRCGASHNKPFCDGAHVEARFRAPAKE